MDRASCNMCRQILRPSMHCVFNTMWAMLLMSMKMANAAEITCNKETNCRCTLSDNSFYYDLEPMLVGVPPPFFNLPDSDATFFYDPCRSFTMASECKDVAVCRETAGGVYQNLGIHGTSDFRYTPTDPSVTLRLMYHNGMSGDNQVNTTVRLTCRTDGISALEVRGSTATFYLLELFSPYACPKEVPIPPSKISAGGIICIIFVVSAVLYFGGGFIYLFFFRYESGHNTIPHYEFWASLPGLIKDGFLYMCSCICGGSSKMQSPGPSYDQI